MQIISDDIRFVTGPPAGVLDLTATVVGTPGAPAASASAPQQFWYWVIVNYPVGSAVSGPAHVANAPLPLNSQNFVRINWSPPENALSFIVVRSSSPEFPDLPGNVAVSPGPTLASVVDDIGLGLTSASSLPLGSGSPAHCRVHLNNRDYQQATLQFPCPIAVSKIIFPDGSSQTTAGGGGGSLPTLVAGPGIQITYGLDTITISNTWPQTPWSGDVNGNNFNLTNVNNVQVNGCIYLGNPAVSLCNDGAGNLLVNGVPVGPAGSNGQVQFNNNGVFGATPHFVFSGGVGVPAVLQLISEGGAYEDNAQFRAVSYETAGVGVINSGGVFEGWAARGTQASPSFLLAGDAIIQLVAWPYIGAGLGINGFGQQGNISINVIADFTSTNRGTQILFFTTPLNSTSFILNATLDYTGMNLLSGSFSVGGVPISAISARARSMGGVDLVNIASLNGISIEDLYYRLEALEERLR